MRIRTRGRNSEVHNYRELTADSRTASRSPVLPDALLTPLETVAGAHAAA
jgi:hypothetical protein